MRMELQQEATDMQTIETRIGSIEHKLDTLNNSVLTLQGSIMPRAEVYAEDAKRVSIERFEGEATSVRDRLNRLESGPQKMLGWISLVVSASVGCLSMIVGSVIGVVSIVVAIIALTQH